MSRSMKAAILALSVLAVACSSNNRTNDQAGYQQNPPANTQADNTAQNKVDQHGTMPEPMDQEEAIAAAPALLADRYLSE